MIRIRISYSRKLIRSINVSGHADSAEYGQDLVCAGMSAVVTGAFNAVDEMFPDFCRLSIAGQMKAKETSLKVIESKDCEALQQVLCFFVLQLQTLAEANPAYINMQKTGEY